MAEKGKGTGKGMRQKGILASNGEKYPVALCIVTMKDQQHRQVLQYSKTMIAFSMRLSRSPFQSFWTVYQNNIRGRIDHFLIIYMVTVSYSICMCLSSTFAVSDVINFLQTTGAFMRVSSASYIQVQH